MLKTNLGCGPVYVDLPDWVNLDFAPVSSSVRKANLLNRLPLADDSASLVYSSHFLEHIPRESVPGFLRECLRVLKPGGVLRLVLPDFEEMARTYLTLRGTGEHERADFLVMEIVDQCVRRESGGELGRYYQRLDDASMERGEMIDFIHRRTGEDLRDKFPSRNPREAHSFSGRIKHIFSKVTRRLERSWIKVVLLALPTAFRTQNVSLAAVGECHRWLWDFHQLQQVLEAEGFTAVERRAADSSGISDFPFYPLDLDSKNLPRKGAESMYIEACKPKK